MAEFTITPSMQGFLGALQKSVLPGVWSKGVGLARSGMVRLEKFSEEEIVARVQNPDRPVSAKVQLWPGDEDHFCDCTERANPCFHVAACVAALRSGLLSSSAEPVPGAASDASAPTLPAGLLRYRFRRAPSGAGRSLLIFERLLDGRPFAESLVATIGGIESGRISGPKIVATQEDFGVDRVLSSFLSSARSTDAFERLASDRGFIDRLFAVLRDVGEVELDGEITAIGTPTSGLEAELREDRDGFRLSLIEGGDDHELFTNGVLLQGGRLRLLRDPGLSADERRILAPPGRAFHGRDIRVLITEVLPALERKIPVRIRTSRLPRADDTPPRLKVELEPLGELELGAAVSIAYRSALSLRDERLEQELLRRVQAELHLVPGHRTRFTGMQAIEFAAKARDFARRHEDEVELAGTGLHRFSVQGELRVDLGPDEGPRGSPTLNLRFTIDGGSAAEPARVLQAWREGSSLVPLIDGGFASLPKEALARHGRILQRLLDLRDKNGGKLPRYAAPEIALLREELTADSGGAGVVLDRAEVRARISGFDGVREAPLPEDLRATLRPYQRQGVNWLCAMRELGMGALLADDMGLGKTLQSLCVVGRNALIAAPASVLQGWADQAARFRPSLRVNRYWGPQRRLDPTADLTITSHALLRQDEAVLEREWDLMILDEAQAIKNPESQVARAAHRVRAGFKIALSGTPVENRLEDLWSPFEFLNPGLLGTRRDFQEDWAAPVQRGDSAAAARLKRRLHPFILRRMKREVAPELPPKTEALLHCELSASERELYDALLSSARREVVEQLDQAGSTFSALELLLRLRQASCHAGLLPGQPAVGSSKLDLLMENLETTVGEGHRALVFSQWTSMLDLIEPALHAAGIRFSRLDGATADRAAVVSEFQSEGGPSVMLLSLKAGGVGLTLTAADHVFLMDSWWNPAVEDQAADRVHRIGQENPVLVYRLIARDTVEEKILELQKRKQALAQSVVGSGAGASQGLTREDLLWLLA